MIADKQEVEELVEELSQHRGRHTELITVYVPAGYDTNAVQKQLEAEKSTAKNIKSTSTRKNVTDALDKIVRFLKEFKGATENGLGIFCGNVAKVEGQDDLQLWSIEPPQALKVRLYRCDKEFVLEPLEEQLEVDEIYGLIVMDRKEATVGVLEGKRIEVIQKMTSGVPSKVRAGGQCLHKSSLVEMEDGLKKIYEIKIGDKIKAFDFKGNKIIFTEVKNKWENMRKDYRIIINSENSIICSKDHTLFIREDGKIKEISAGSLSLNNILLNSLGENVLIDTIIDNKNRVEMVDLETESGNFIANGLVVHNSSQRFHRITEGLTKEFYKRIADEAKSAFYENKKLKGILVGGPVPTKDEFLDNEYLPTQLQQKVIGRVDIGDTDESGLHELVEKSQDILASQEIIREKKLLERFFEALGERPDFVVYHLGDIEKALEYGAVGTLYLSKDLDKEIVKKFKTKAENIGADVEIISTDTEEGKQFEQLSGIGALLRFKY